MWHPPQIQIPKYQISNPKLQIITTDQISTTKQFGKRIKRFRRKGEIGEQEKLTPGFNTGATSRLYRTTFPLFPSSPVLLILIIFKEIYLSFGFSVSFPFPELPACPINPVIIHPFPYLEEPCDTLFWIPRERFEDRDLHPGEALG